MTNTLRSKTWASTLSLDPRSLFAWISDRDNLPRWYNSLNRSAAVRFVRDDRALLLDLVAPLDSGELPVAIRVLPNGAGSEVVLTLVQPAGLSDADFQEELRQAESALAQLQSLHAGELPVEASPVTAEIASIAAPVPNAGKKLYIGNLPYAWTDEALRDLFATQGTIVKAEIARFRGRGGEGRSRGFGFVEMSTEAEAQGAIEKLHDALAGDRKMVVRLARSQENRQDRPAPMEPGAAPPGAPAQARPSAARHSRGGRNRGGRGRPAVKTPRPERPAASRPRRETGISNNSGYEIYPRDAKGGFASEPTARSSAPRAPSEPGPYMEDTGDFENRGNRPPRRRR